MTTTTLIALVLSGTAMAANPAQESFAKPDGPAAEAMQTLADALALVEKGEPAQGSNDKVLAKACQAAVDHVAPQSLVGEKLSAAISDSRKLPPRRAADLLARAAREALKRVTFQPRREAELPLGFPTYTPSGVIEVKQYPACRMAVGQGFWPLFTHISRNGVAMTAPVKMEYEKQAAGNFAVLSMAFLYERPDQGQPGRQGSVNVMNATQETVVATGVRGMRTKQNLSDAHQRLKRWIAANPKYAAAGSWRVMAYNSPFVPAEHQFFEVQVPVKEVTTEMQRDPKGQETEDRLDSGREGAPPTSRPSPPAPRAAVHLQTPKTVRLFGR